MEKLAEAAKDVVKLISDSRCENCGFGYRAKDKKWCGRCIDVYYRKQTRSPKEVNHRAFDIVEPLFANATLKDIDPDILQSILNRSPYQDVFLWGLAGRGKTYLMAALIRHYLGEGYECKRICFDDFLCEVRATMSPASKRTEREMTEPLTKIDMLFIDDLALRVNMESDFAYVTFYTILNKRQERLLPTFISSNKNLDRLRQSFDERIVSRLGSALIIELTGKDRRKSVNGKI